MNKPVIFPFDFVKARQAIARQIQAVCVFDENHVIYEEPETQDFPPPKTFPYMGFKITTPAGKSGDDSKDQVLDDMGIPTTRWNSGGVRKMTVVFDCYANTHEEAYNYMGLWQTFLDTNGVQQSLGAAGIAVWIIGNVADLSQLLNTGYEGRAHMECTFGIAMNAVTDLGEIESVEVQGTIGTDSGRSLRIKR